MYKYGYVLTGSIGTGKSTVASLLKLHGFEIIDADVIAHQLLDANYSKIGELFGQDVIKDGRVERKKLGAIVFSDEVARGVLESFLHPLIKQQILTLADKAEAKKIPYIVDIPLFFETNNYPFDKVIVVYTKPDIQLMRISKRDKISLDEAQKKVNLQLSIDKKRDLANIIIDNTGTLKELQVEVEKLSAKLQ